MKKVQQLQSLNFFRKKFLLFHIPNERKSHALVKINLKQMGVKAGIADYCILIEGGKCAFLEMKRNEKCKLTKPQEEFFEICNILNIPVLRTHCVDNAIAWIQELLT